MPPRTTLSGNDEDGLESPILPSKTQAATAGAAKGGGKFEVSRNLGKTLLAALVFCLLFIRSLPPNSYAKDIQFVYVTALALRDGSDIFTPIAELSGKYLHVVSQQPEMVSYLPPVVSLVSLPLTFLPYSVFVVIWLCLNFGLLAFIGRRLNLSLPGSVALAAWPPALWILDNGNLELVILCLALLGWMAARKGRDPSAGIWLGLAAVVKFYPALFLIPFLWRRRFRLVAFAGLAFALGQAGNLIAAGLPGLFFYYRQILPRGSSLYLSLALNSAPHGAFLRLFGGAEDVSPIIAAPWLVLPATVVVSILGLLALAKLEPEDAPLAVMTILPNVKGYVSVLALPSVLKVWGSEGRNLTSILACAAVSFVLPLANAFIILAHLVFAEGNWRLSSLTSVLTGFQAAGYMGLLLLRAMMHNGTPSRGGDPAA